MADLIAFSRIDIIGMQEVNADQMESLKTLLPELHFVGIFLHTSTSLDSERHQPLTPANPGGKGRNEDGGSGTNLT